MTRERNRHTTEPITASSFDLSTRLLSTDEVARLLVVPVATLYCWRYKGTGPKAFRVGKHLRYRLDDVIEWLELKKE
jgi:excisionase family DNA binding protein